MRRNIQLALTACLLLVTSSSGAPTQPDPATEEDLDRQIGDMLQKLESANNLGPREKRAVNVLSGLLGGGGGGNILNELNKGPTYSQLLGGGGGFNKAGLLSGFLGSSSGTAVLNRRPLVSLSLGGGAGIIDQDPENVVMRYNVQQQRDNPPEDLDGPTGGVSAHLAIPLRGPLGLFLAPLLAGVGLDPLEDDYPVDELPISDDLATDDEYDYDQVRAAELVEDEDNANDEDEEDVNDSSTTSPYPSDAPEPQAPRTLQAPRKPQRPQNLSNFGRDPIASKRPRKQRGGNGKRARSNGGATAGASVSDGLSGSDASGGAAAGGGSDSGSILSLVTPLLGSSSAGAAGGTDGGAGAGLSLGGGASGGANAIKSFIFRKLAQLLGSSSGSPQAG